MGEKPLVKSPFPPFLAFILDNPLRRVLIDRERFLRGMGVKEGDHVLEIGCGPGFFTETLSMIVGENGRVYAQDVEEAMVERVRRKSAGFRFSNVVPLLSNSSLIALAPGSCNVALCANVIEEIYKEGELEGTVAELDRVLRKPAVVIVKEHRFGGTGPMVRKAEKLMLNLGYEKVLEEVTFFSYHMRFRK
ncbi:MAG: methyltransferase domain-containing protein [Deltaproteobacteria bacterium]|nr:methyltransferase domain-containing protein [Deltaproteobacteria bacterium]